MSIALARSRSPPDRAGQAVRSALFLAGIPYDEGNLGFTPVFASAGEIYRVSRANRTSLAKAAGRSPARFLRIPLRPGAQGSTSWPRRCKAHGLRQIAVPRVRLDDLSGAVLLGTWRHALPAVGLGQGELGAFKVPRARRGERYGDAGRSQYRAGSARVCEGQYASMEISLRGTLVVRPHSTIGPRPSPAGETAVPRCRGAGARHPRAAGRTAASRGAGLAPVIAADGRMFHRARSRVIWAGEQGAVRSTPAQHAAGERLRPVIEHRRRRSSDAYSAFFGSAPIQAGHGLRRGHINWASCERSAAGSPRRLCGATASSSNTAGSLLVMRQDIDDRPAGGHRR